MPSHRDALCVMRDEEEKEFLFSPANTITNTTIERSFLELLTGTAAAGTAAAE
jgi:hypothetical protein